MTLASVEPGWFIWPSILVFSCTFDALYSGVETGLYVMNKVRLDLAAASGAPGAGYLQRAVRQSDNTLSVLLIGVNGARYISTFCITSMFVLAGGGKWSELYTILVGTPFFFVFGDAVPKAVFQRVGDRAMYPLRWLLRGSDVVFTLAALSPLVRLVSGGITRLAGARGADGHGARGIGDVLAEGRAAGALSGFQSVMAQRVARMHRLRVADTMTPLRQTVRAPKGITRDQARELYRRCDYSRIPVTDGGRIVGLLDLQDALTAPEDVQPAQLMTPPLRVRAADRVNEALYRMQRRGAVMAAVEDRRGTDIGIVTIKDLVQEVVGEIPDAEPPRLQRMGQDELVLEASLPPEDWPPRLAAALPGARETDLAEYVASRLGRAPREGDVLATDAARLTVESVRHGRIGRLRVELGGAP